MNFASIKYHHGDAFSHLFDIYMAAHIQNSQCTSILFLIQSVFFNYKCNRKTWEFIELVSCFIT